MKNIRERGVFWWGLCLILSLAARSSFGEGSTVVIILAGEGTPVERARRVENAIVNGAARDSGLSIMGREVLPEAFPRGPQLEGRVRAAISAINAGVKATQQAQFDNALTLFKEAMASLHVTQIFRNNCKELAIVHVNLASLLFGQGDRAQTEEQLQEVLRTSPSFALDPKIFSPAMVSTFNQVREAGPYHVLSDDDLTLLSDLLSAQTIAVGRLMHSEGPWAAPLRLQLYDTRLRAFTLEIKARVGLSEEEELAQGTWIGKRLARSLKR